MIRFILRRVLASIPVLLLVSLITFGLLWLVPGDPASMFLDAGATAEALDRVRRELGLDQPFLVRMGQWYVRLLQGDLGQSLLLNRSVVDDFVATWGLGPIGEFRKVANENGSISLEAQEFLRLVNPLIDDQSGPTEARLRGVVVSTLERGHPGHGARPSRAEARAFYDMTNSVGHADARWLTAQDMRKWLGEPAPETLVSVGVKATPKIAFADASYLDSYPVLP